MHDLFLKFNDEHLHMEYIIKRISITSAVKISAILHAIVSLLIGIIYGGVLIIISLVDVLIGGGSITSGGIGLAISILSLIGLPIGGLIWGAICGAVLSLMYNFASDYIGGITFELREKPKKE